MSNEEIISRIKELEDEVLRLKTLLHNRGVNGAAMSFVNKLKNNATEAELKFKEILEKKGLSLQFQYKIDIVEGDSIKKFYITDFCDTTNKIIIEVDGGIHNRIDIIRKDKEREFELKKLGYKIYRITNDDVLNGKSTQLLYTIYPHLSSKVIN